MGHGGVYGDRRVDLGSHRGCRGLHGAPKGGYVVTRPWLLGFGALAGPKGQGRDDMELFEGKSGVYWVQRLGLWRHSGVYWDGLVLIRSQKGVTWGHSGAPWDLGSPMGV